MGDFSCSLYLVHYPIIATTCGLAGGDLTNPQKIAAPGVVTVLSLIFFALVERPLERWRERRMVMMAARPRRS